MDVYFARCVNQPCLTQTIENVNGREASKLALRPMRTVKIDHAEYEEIFANRLLNKDIQSDDDDGTN